MSTRDEGAMRVLSIDGGGMFGVMSAVYLREIERALVERHGAAVRLRDFFEIVAGTSTGSILATAVSSGMAIDRIIRLYEDRGTEIFRRKPLGLSRWGWYIQGSRYSGDGLGRVLREELVSEDGQPLRMGMLDDGPLTLITAYDVLTHESVVFKSSHAHLREVELWQLVKASCSAPTYFPPHVMSIAIASPSSREANPANSEHLPDPITPRDKIAVQERALVDGGVFANNPAMFAAAEALRLRRADESGAVCDTSGFVLASIGNIRGSEGKATADSVRRWGALQWANRLHRVFMDGAEAASQYVSRHMIGGDRVTRFEHEGLAGAKLEMDRADPVWVRELIALATAYIGSPERQDAVRHMTDQLGEPRARA